VSQLAIRIALSIESPAGVNGPATPLVVVETVTLDYHEGDTPEHLGEVGAGLRYRLDNLHDAAIEQIANVNGLLGAP
jgi:hypothetical protein